MLNLLPSFLPSKCTFNLYRFDTQFAIIIFEDNNANRLPETVVGSITASSSKDVYVKDGVFVNNLELSGILKGRNLNSCKSSDFSVGITYRNNTNKEAPLKVNGSFITQNTSKDNTVPGYEYCHYFFLENVSESSLMSNEGSFSFTINLEGIKTSEFSDGLLVEFYNKIFGEKVHPFYYSEFYRFNKKEVVNIKISSNRGNIDNSGKYILNPEFIVEIGRNLSDSDKKKIEAAVTVSDVESDKIIKKWKDNNLYISFKDGLIPQTTYTVSVADITDTDEIVIKDTEDLTFTTKIINSYFSISYNLNGGNLEEGAANPVFYGIASETITVANPKRTGYAFTGWTGTGLTGENNMSVSIPQGSHDNREYTAHWSTDAYTIACSLDGGSVATPNQTTYYVTSDAITLNNPTKNYYTFIGWTGSNGVVPQMTVTIPQGSTGNRSYTANYVPVSYTIAYNLNDGAVATANPERYDITSATINLNNPAKDYYNFKGWSGTGLDGDANTNTSVSIPSGSNGNRSYTANYTPVSYTIVYHLDGGSAAGNPQNYDITSASININNPERAGYTFTGWSGTGLTGENNMSVSIPQGSHDNREYTAHWSINSYRLDLIAGTGISSVSGAGVYQYGANVAATCTFEPGYELYSWTGDITTDTFSMPAANATMTANARPISYSIEYNLNGGDVAAANPTSYDITSATITLNKPTKAGTYFMGWSCDGIVGASMTFTIPAGSTGNRVFTANWGETLTFNINGVDLVMQKIPAGTFMMGSPEAELGRLDWYEDYDELQHRVTISKPFYMGRFEITREQLYNVMKDALYYSEYDFGLDKPHNPIRYLAWEDAMEFVDTLNTLLADQLPAGYRFDLPTEAQWEYACRAGTTTSLNSGKNIIVENAFCPNLDELAWFWFNVENLGGESQEVGQKAPNAWGLYDMHGNIRELCKDFYDEEYYATCGDCVDPTGPIAAVNPSWPEYVVRGGSYHCSPFDCRSAYRDCGTYGDDDLGFRVVLVQY